MANKNTRSHSMGRYITRKETDLRNVIAITVIAILVAFTVIWEVDRTPTVYKSITTGEVVRIEDGKGRPVPVQKWDAVLASRYDFQWVQ